MGCWAQRVGMSGGCLSGLDMSDLSGGLIDTVAVPISGGDLVGCAAAQYRV